MRMYSRSILRVAMGLFLVVWGADKLINVDHAIAVSEGFYGGLFSSRALLMLGGVVQIGLGMLVIAGRLRTLAYGGLLLITTWTLVAVWRSVLDPLGLYLGGNPVFFSSVVIWAAALYLWAHRDEAAEEP